MSDKKKWLAITVGIQMLVVLWFFGPVIKHPNSYFFSSGPDAIKNYYIPAYFIRYDQGIHFSGMNYPYGEHSLFTDNQFPVSILLQFVQHHFFNVADDTTAFMNLLMIFSLVFCPVFIFLLLYELGVRNWFAAISSIGIALLSPQVQRMTGHFSLSYCFFIPMIFYFLFRLISGEGKFLWVALIIVSDIFFGLIHLYYSAIIASFLFCFLFFYFIHSRGKKSGYRNELYILLCLIVPLIFIQVFMSLTDSIGDRTKNPWGFFVGYATWQSVLYPPNWNGIKIFGINDSPWEGYAYIGIIGLPALSILIIQLLRHAIMGKFRKFLRPSLPEFLLISFYASIPVLLFSMCYPWKFHLENWADHFPLLLQFRSLGRFAWIFYYSITIFSAYYFFLIIRMFNIHKLKLIGQAVAALCTFGWAFDAYYNFQPVLNLVNYGKIASDFWSKDSYIPWLHSAGYKPADFQAILSFPAFHIGSEKFWLDAPSSIFEATKASYNTGLPIAEGYLARTSLSQTLKLVQLSSSPLIEKEVLKDYKPDKLLLLLVAEGILTPQEKIIISKADSIYGNPYIKLYRLPLTALQPDFEKVRTEFLAQKDSALFHRDTYFSSTPARSIMIADFTTGNDTGKFLSGGKYADSGRVELFKGVIPDASDTQRMVISCWIKVFGETYDFPWFSYLQSDEQGSMIDYVSFTPKASEDIYGNWVLCTFFFALKNKKNTVEFYLRGKKAEVSRLLIRPADADVYYDFKSDGSFVFNNYFIPGKE